MGAGEKMGTGNPKTSNNSVILPRCPPCEPWSVVAELLPSSNWLLLGLHRQPFRVGLERAARDSVVLRWRLLVLTAGYVPLPALILHKLPIAAEPGEGVGVGQGIELPIPAYLMGSTVLVAAKDAVIEMA